MVGVINPNASVSIQVQSQDAKDSQYMLQPGENFPSEGSSTSKPSAASSTSDANEYASSSTASATSAAVASKSSSSSLSKGAIGGIVVAAVIVLLLAAALFFFVGRARTLKETVNRQSLYPSVASMGGASSARGGHLSPASPPMRQATVGGVDPMYQAGGTVYIPVKATDLQRVSLPAYGAEVQGQGQQGQQQSHYEYGTPPPQQQQQQQRYV
jgi:hypothetical protein